MESLFRSPLIFLLVVSSFSLSHVDISASDDESSMLVCVEKDDTVVFDIIA